MQLNERQTPTTRPLTPSELRNDVFFELMAAFFASICCNQASRSEVNKLSNVGSAIRPGSRAFAATNSAWCCDLKCKRTLLFEPEAFSPSFLSQI